MLRILVVDPYPVVRQGVKQILQSGMAASVAEESVCTEETVEAVKQNACDLVVLDIGSADGGIKTVNKLRSARPGLPVLVFSMRPEDEYAVPLLSVGAAGFLSKESTPAELIAAVRKLCRGGKYISSRLAETMITGIQPRPAMPVNEILSKREYQTLLMLASGKTVGGISRELDISVKTVSTYRTRVLDKLGFNSNAALTRYALKQGLIS